MSELNSSNQMGEEVELELDDNGSAEDIQIALAPYIQNYLSQTRRRHSCCSVVLPVAFERAANKSWLNPKFDSPVLEDQFRTSVFPQIRLRFRFALGYILFCSLIWTIYFLCDSKTDDPWIILCICLLAISIFCIIGVWQTYTIYFKKYSNIISAYIGIFIIITSLCFLVFGFNSFSALGQFAICIEIIFIIYTVIPLPLWQCGCITIIYSIVFELITNYLQNNKNLVFVNYKSLTIRILLQLCVHLIGIHVLIMNVVRMRGTFMKVGKNLLVRGQLEMEKKLKEKMIHSVMPPKVADILLKEGEHNVIDNNDKSQSRRSNEINLRTTNDVKSMFRPFHMVSMNNVSILFADIVGFTKMSSSKTADQLVEILNDLFERFDNLCEMKGCEKISTLGDCYYCVSGCPEPRPDHAICCIEMGLGMITVMQVFDAERHEGVQIRVGVHTGNVLCGIVGTRRVKFDVWSNDVTLANRMESTGRPEQVHISQETSNFLGDVYMLEEGEEVCGHRTFFVMGRKKDSSCASGMDIDYLNNGFNNFDKVSQTQSSTTQQLDQQLSVPPTSPVGYSAGPSPILSLRPRLSSLSKVTKYLSSRKTDNKILQQPKIIITAKSLPGSLNSDNNDDNNINGLSDLKNVKIVENEITKSPKPKPPPLKFKNWKVPKFLRKTDEFKIQIDDKKIDVTNTVDQNGYFQLPILIETQHQSCNNTLTIPNKPRHFQSLQSSPKEGHSENIICPSLQYSMFDDIIDVKSYISQSRSDISPFGRSGSYRSHSGRSPNDDTSPTACRPRSSTLASQFVDCGGNIQNKNIYLGPSGDRLSICPSVASRKDSGIRSNSRRSSIQQQLYTLNQTHNRVSGYFTSSQSSLSNNINPIDSPNVLPHHTNLPHPDPLAACLQQLRKQSDLQLIKCVRENAQSKRSYLVKPPLSPFSLFFDRKSMEKDFRNNAHNFGIDKDNDNNGYETLATPKFNTFLDIFVGVLFYFSITASLFLLASTSSDLSYRVWVCLFVSFSFIQCFVLLVSANQIFNTNNKTSRTTVNCTENIIFAISGFYSWHICGAIILILPTIAVLVNFSLSDSESLQLFEYHYGFLLFLCIIHFCNFTQLNCWMRNILATFAGVCFIMISIIHNKIMQEHFYLNIINNNSIIIDNNYENNSNINKLQMPIDNLKGFNHTDNFNNKLFLTTSIYKFQNYRTEICIDIILLIILVWFLNREFEIGYRLTFYGSLVANQDKIRVQNMKNQADMLLHNIIPKFVAEQIKNTAKYSENHFNIGIIFASIVNFNELYDESYLGGKEYLRVLNELIGDFDELLSRTEYQCVEKIKTIGSTFMAASGLDPTNRREDFQHLYSLIEFSLAMQNVVESFNKDLIEFNLILRIGYNIGDVTAGVIGRSKLYYDIWGDAVNVASRMDSTGVSGRIQMGKSCIPFLDTRYNFESRGKVYVKGKDHMEVFLLNGRKPDLPGDEIDFIN